MFLATEDNLVQVAREESTPYLQMHISQLSPAQFVVLRKDRKMKICLGSPELLFVSLNWFSSQQSWLEYEV